MINKNVTTEMCLILFAYIYQYIYIYRGRLVETINDKNLNNNNINNTNNSNFLICIKHKTKQLQFLMHFFF